jgi:membrane-bound ClpP family serine protease
MPGQRHGEVRVWIHGATIAAPPDGPYAPVVTLLVALLLAFFVLPSPWGVVAVLAALVFEVGEAAGLVWWSRRRRSHVGAETLVGAEGVALGALEPDGQVRVGGEIWRARSEAPVPAGCRVRVTAVEALTLVVEPCA